MTDAWKQYHDLIASFTTEDEPRPDLRVVALAHERGVELSLGVRRDDWKPLDVRGKFQWTTTQRNVSTMRELAQAIIDACDFVDAANPDWVDRGVRMGLR